MIIATCMFFNVRQLCTLTMLSCLRDFNVSASTNMASIYDVQGQTGLEYEPDGHFATFAGFILHEFARIPAVGEKLEWNNWVIEVVNFEGKRIGKVKLARRLEEE